MPSFLSLMSEVKSGERKDEKERTIRLKLLTLFFGGLGLAGVVLAFTMSVGGGLLLVAFSAYQIFVERLPKWAQRVGPWALSAAVALVVFFQLTTSWLPLGPTSGLLKNLVFVGVLIGGLLSVFLAFQQIYPRVLRWCLDHKFTFLLVPFAITLLGGCSWLGFDTMFGFAPDVVRQSAPWQRVSKTFPGLGKEFIPSLDEGSYLFMPTTMPHASIGAVMDVLQIQDKSIGRIPEVESVVGKLGRAETPLDPAPISMIETVINYRPEYITDKSGARVNFRFDEKADDFLRDSSGALIPDENGRPYRQWRDHIKSPDDIWKEILAATELPGSTSAPKLQPIAARIVMLQSGMRAPMGVKVKGPDLDTIEGVALQLERYLKEVPSVAAATVTADRLVGKPYLEVELDRKALGRYGLHIGTVQQVIEVAIGGKRITSTVEGRERYPVRVRYLRELRDTPESLGRILVPTMDGAQIPLAQIAEIRYVRGPQAIKSEDTFLIGYVVFDKKADTAEVDVVEECQAYLQAKLDSGEFVLPTGVSYTFAGNYENQIRSQKTLSIVLPLALFIIFIILYLQFNSVLTTMLDFSGIIVAWAGGFIFIWLYSVPGFLNFEVFGANMRDLFQVDTINLSVAIWVGFLALFGIASDDGVVMATYLNQTFADEEPTSRDSIREMVVTGAQRRIRPALMTTATTILALIPVLTSTGRGSDIMVPMAIPSFGGMVIAIMTMLIVPVLYCSIQEGRFRMSTTRSA